MKAPDDLREFAAILVETYQDPMAMIPQTDEERRLLASSVNSSAVYRQVMGGRGNAGERGPPGMRGAGRAGLSSRGRGRGRNDVPFPRVGFDDGHGTDSYRASRGSRER